MFSKIFLSYCWHPIISLSIAFLRNFFKKFCKKHREPYHTLYFDVKSTSFIKVSLIERHHTIAVLAPETAHLFNLKAVADGPDMVWGQSLKSQLLLGTIVRVVHNFSQS